MLQTHKMQQHLMFIIAIRTTWDQPQFVEIHYKQLHALIQIIVNIVFTNRLLFKILN